MPAITRDEAVELCIHHLRLAAAYFQATPDDNNQSLEIEINRTMKADDCERLPALAWAGTIYGIYEKMKDAD